MDLEFSNEIWYWRGPAPFYFVTVPEEPAADISAVSSMATYGWGCIPVKASVGKTEFTTSLFPKDDGYIVPVKVAVRKAEKIELGDIVTIRLSIDF